MKTHQRVLLKYPSDATQRSVFRWVHIILGIPIIGYIYSPFDKIPQYAPLVRFVFLPIMVLIGLWMWKGHVLLRLILKGSARSETADNSRGQAIGKK